MKPSIEIPDHLRQLLRSRSPTLLSSAERFLAAAPKRCTYIRSERVSEAPLQGTVLGRWLGRQPATPVLGPLDSKFGGLPYAEEAHLTWDRFRFLGQINFARIEDPPPNAPRQGLLAVDLAPQIFRRGAFRVRWYPEPSEARSQLEAPPPCVGKWEGRMVFSPGWSLPGGEAWDAPLPAEDEELWQAWNDWAPQGFQEDERSSLHRLLGHRSGGLDEHYGFEATTGRGADIREYEMLWRIASDEAAGFRWGTNLVYVLVHSRDLEEGRLDRAIVTGANS